MNQKSATSQSAQVLIYALWAVIFVTILSLISSLFQYQLLQQALVTGELSAESASSNDTREMYVALLLFIVFVICMILFLRWFYLSYSLLQKKSVGLQYTNGWAIWSWFVPFLNLFRPLRMMKELFSETKRVYRKHEVSYEETETKENDVNIWWGLWISSGVVSQWAMRMQLNARSIESLSNVTIMDMISSLFVIASGYYAIKVVKNYDSVQEQLVNIPDMERGSTKSRYLSSDL